MEDAMLLIRERDDLWTMLGAEAVAIAAGKMEEVYDGLRAQQAMPLDGVEGSGMRHVEEEGVALEEGFRSHGAIVAKMRQPDWVQTPSEYTNQGVSEMELKRYNVRVRRFDPSKGIESGEEFVLPVDSPDEEHGVSAAMSNAIAFTTKVKGGTLLPATVLPVAFCCVGVTERK